MRRLRLLAAPLAVTAMVGCGDTTGPDQESVSGTYTATRLTITSGAVTTDLLDAGARITFTLNPDGTTAGTMSVPPAPGIEPVNADLSGTWTLDGRTVTFSHSADTFLRDMTFRYTEPGTLFGDDVYPEGLVEVELTRMTVL